MNGRALECDNMCLFSEYVLQNVLPHSPQKFTLLSEWNICLCLFTLYTELKLFSQTLHLCRSPNLGTGLLNDCDVMACSGLCLWKCSSCIFSSKYKKLHSNTLIFNREVWTHNESKFLKFWLLSNSNQINTKLKWTYTRICEKAPWSTNLHAKVQQYQLRIKPTRYKTNVSVVFVFWSVTSMPLQVFLVFIAFITELTHKLSNVSMGPNMNSQTVGIRTFLPTNITRRQFLIRVE